MASSNSSGVANAANDPGEVVYTTSFTPDTTGVELVVCGTAHAKVEGLASVKVEYRYGTEAWQPAGYPSGAGSGQVVLFPQQTALAVTQGTTYQVRVVINDNNTETLPEDDFFSITVLELEPESA